MAERIPDRPPRYQLRVDVSIYDTQGGGNLRCNEEFSVNSHNFLEMMQVIGRFHELAEKIKQEQKL